MSWAMMIAIGSRAMLSPSISGLIPESAFP
jgi:hypothetical protein